MQYDECLCGYRAERNKARYFEFFNYPFLLKQKSHGYATVAFERCALSDKLFCFTPKREHNDSIRVIQCLIFLCVSYYYM